MCYASITARGCRRRGRIGSSWSASRSGLRGTPRTCHRPPWPPKRWRTTSTWSFLPPCPKRVGRERPSPLRGRGTTPDAAASSPSRAGCRYAPPSPPAACTDGTDTCTRRTSRGRRHRRRTRPWRPLAVPAKLQPSRTTRPPFPASGAERAHVPRRARAAGMSGRAPATRKPVQRAGRPRLPMPPTRVPALWTRSTLHSLAPPGPPRRRRSRGRQRRRCGGQRRRPPPLCRPWPSCEACRRCWARESRSWTTSRPSQCVASAPASGLHVMPPLLAALTHPFLRARDALAASTAGGSGGGPGARAGGPGHDPAVAS